MMVNTNNGNERLNVDLKYDELVEYKSCTLCDLLNVVIDKFIPKLYEKYIELNLRYTSCYKEYDRTKLTMLKVCQPGQAKRKPIE